MPVIQMVAQALPRQIEFPANKGMGPDKKPIELKRSCEGALHLKPGTTLDITDDELAHLKKNEPETFKVIRVLAKSPAVKAPDLVKEPLPVSSQPAAPPAAASGTDDKPKPAKK